MIVHLVQQVRLDGSSEVEEKYPRTRKRCDIGAPQHSGGSDTQEVGQPNRVHIRNRRRALNYDRVAPTVAAQVDPQGYSPVFHIDEIGAPVAIHIANQNPLGIVTPREARAVGHMDPLAPVAIAEVRPIIDAAGVDEGDILHSVASEIGPFDAWVRPYRD